ncbi:hypothetical protein Tco_1331515 [Tanacetum coccineum]
MSAMGELTFFLGLQVQQRPDGIFISQDKYVQEILKKFDLECVRTATTPYEAPKPKSKNEPDSPVNVHLYRSMISSLMYLTASRPDIMFAFSACSSNQVTPTTSNLEAVKKIFKYLKGQPKLGLWYPRESPFVLEAYSDSDYAGANKDRKSTTGGCQFLGRRLISWQCKKQTIMVSSSVPSSFTRVPAGSFIFPTGRTLPTADDGGIDDLPIAVIYSGMDNLGYVTEGKLTFYKNKFSPQLRFLVHTILYCLCTKSGSWDQFGSPIAVALICLSDRRKFNWSSYIFKGMLNFEGQPMQLLAAMLPQVQEGEGAGVAAQAVPPPILEPMPEPDQPQDHLSTPLRHQTSDPFTSTNVEDEPLGGSFHASPLRSTQAPPAGHTSGGAEDLITLTDVSSVVSTLVQKVNLLETELKDTKKLFKDMVGKLVKKVKAMEVKLKTKKRKVVVTVIVDSNIPPGGASSSHIPTDVPTGVAPAGVSNKGKTPMVEEDITVEANASLSKTLLGDDVTEDNFPVRMAALIKRKKQALAEKLAKERMERPMTLVKVESFTDAQLKVEFEKIQKALANTQVQAFSRTLKRTELDLDADDKTFIKFVSDEDSTDEAPILWSALAGWEILHMVDKQDLLKLYGMVVKYYENHLVTGAGLMLWGDLQVLMDS